MFAENGDRTTGSMEFLLHRQRVTTTTIWTTVQFLHASHLRTMKTDDLNEPRQSMKIHGLNLEIVRTIINIYHDKIPKPMTATAVGVLAPLMLIPVLDLHRLVTIPKLRMNINRQEAMELQEIVGVQK